MDVAAAVVSFVGILGQCLQGCNFLSNFFSNVLDAPQIIRDTAAELHLLIALLETFRKIISDLHAPNTNFDLAGARAAIELLGEALGRLTRLVVKYASVIAPACGRRVYKTWKALDHAWRRSQLRSHLRQLQHAKISLLMAQSNILLSQNTAQTVLLRQYEQGRHVAFRQQRSHIRKTVTSVLQSSVHRTHRLLDNHIGAQAEPLLPLVEAVSPFTAVNSSKISPMRRRHVAIIPQWKLDDHKNSLSSPAKPTLTKAASNTDHSWMPLPPDCRLAPLSYQSDARPLRRRARFAERQRNNTARARDLNVYLETKVLMSLITVLSTGGMLAVGSGTIIFRAVQLVIQVKQTL